jgi:exodeoxyribonuclease VII small subunit
VTGQEINMAKKGDENNQEKKELSIEEAFTQVDEKISSLEKDDVTLEDSFRYFKEGMELLKYCSDSIDQVEKKVQKIMGNGETEDFE